MTRVFIEPGVLLQDATAERRQWVSPGIEGAIENLTEAGHDVVVLGELPAGLIERCSVASAAGPIGPPGWLVTGERRDCGRSRRRGLRTILVGPSDGLEHPTERCDLEARDLSAAALIILAAEAMGSRPD